MLNADDTSSSPSDSATEPSSSLASSLHMQMSDTLRSLLFPAQQLRKVLQVQSLLLPDTSSWVPLWQSSSSLLTSALGTALQPPLSSSLLPMEEITASIRSKLTPGLLANALAATEVANAVVQMETIVSPSIALFQRERFLFQHIVPASQALEHLVISSQGWLIQDFLSSQHHLLQQMGDFSHLLNTSLLTLTHQLPEWLQRTEEWLRQRLLAAFQRAKLCLAPSLSDEVMYRIIGYVEAGDLRPVTTLLWSYYARNRHARLHQAMGSWFDHPEFAARRHIFEQAFTAHGYGHYVASIRTLTPEIEGLGSYVVRKQNLRAVNKQGQDIGLHLGKPDSVVSRMVDAAEAADPGLLHWVRTRSTRAYLNVVLTKTNFEHEYDRVRNLRDVNRHGIAHGFQIQGYTWLNSLRLFLLLDTIHYLLRATEQRAVTSKVVI